MASEGEAVVNQLFARIVGTSVSQPDINEFTTDVGGLIESLCAPTGPPDNLTCGAVNQRTGVNRTVEVIKAACGAALGSGATLVQ